jgi:hypothetical protein
VSKPKPTVFFFGFKGRGNFRGSFFAASIDRIYMIYWIFFFITFLPVPLKAGMKVMKKKPSTFTNKNNVL